MSILDDEDLIIQNHEKNALLEYVKNWLSEYTYSRYTWFGDEPDELDTVPKIIIKDFDTVDLEYPSVKYKLVIQGEIPRIPTEYFRFGKINCGISLGENFKQFPGALESLEGLPTIVYGIYDASWCTSLKSLKGLPKEIIGSLYLQGVNFNIKDHIYLPEYIEGDLYINIDNQIDADLIYKNHHIRGLIIDAKTSRKFQRSGILMEIK